VFGHGWDQFVEHAALAEEGMGAGFRGIGLEQPVHAECLAGGAEHGEQGDGKGVNEQQTVAAGGFADPGGAEPPAEAQVLGIAEMGFDAPTPGVGVDQQGGGGLGVADGQAPGFPHPRGRDAHGADPMAPGGELGIAQFAGPAALTDPSGRVWPAASLTGILPRTRMT
jgi:hypothetical protein